MISLTSRFTFFEVTKIWGFKIPKWISPARLLVRASCWGGRISIQQAPTPHTNRSQQRATEYQIWWIARILHPPARCNIFENMQLTPIKPADCTDLGEHQKCIESTVNVFGKFIHWTIGPSHIGAEKGTSPRNINLPSTNPSKETSDGTMWLQFSFRRGRFSYRREGANGS